MSSSTCAYPHTRERSLESALSLRSVTSDAGKSNTPQSLQTDRPKLGCRGSRRRRRRCDLHSPITTSSSWGLGLLGDEYTRDTGQGRKIGSDRPPHSSVVAPLLWILAQSLDRMELNVLPDCAMMVKIISKRTIFDQLVQMCVCVCVCVFQ